MCKLTENSFRDINIAFANELSVICEKLNINVWELIGLANRHPRVNILQPGPGVGGHCIAVDPWFIVNSAPLEAKLIRSAREVNDAKPAWVISKVKSAVERVLLAAKNSEREIVDVVFFGVSFKANIDDLRESPSVSIVRECEKIEGVRCYVVEPNISELPEDLSGSQLLSCNQVIRPDVAVVLVDHDEFMCDEFRKFVGGCNEIIDCRGVIARPETLSK